jgi:hypothetical protein
MLWCGRGDSGRPGIVITTGIDRRKDRITALDKPLAWEPSCFIMMSMMITWQLIVTRPLAACQPYSRPVIVARCMGDLSVRQQQNFDPFQGHDHAGGMRRCHYQCHNLSICDRNMITATWAVRDEQKKNYMEPKKVYTGQPCYLLKCVTQNYNSKSRWEPDFFILTVETWLYTQIYLSSWHHIGRTNSLQCVRPSRCWFILQQPLVGVTMSMRPHSSSQMLQYTWPYLINKEYTTFSYPKGKGYLVPLT